MIKKIAWIFDSTATLTPEIKALENVFEVNLSVTFGNESFKENEDLTTREFFQKIDETGIFPKSSQPAIGDIINAFKEAEAKGYEEIVALTVSSKLSGTNSTFHLASQEVSIPCHIIDTTFSSHMMEHLMKFIKMRYEETNDLILAIEEGNEYKKDSKILVLVDDLDYLKRSGRVSGLTGIIGSLLKIKPLVKLHEGQIVPCEKIRGFSKGLNRMKEIVERHSKKGQISYISVIYANSSDDTYNQVLKLKAELEALKLGVEVLVNELPQSISVHSGPNSIGLAWMDKEPTYLF